MSRPVSSVFSVCRVVPCLDEFLKLLGRGTFSQVILCRDLVSSLPSEDEARAEALAAQQAQQANPNLVQIHRRPQNVVAIKVVRDVARYRHAAEKEARILQHLAASRHSPCHPAQPASDLQTAIGMQQDATIGTYGVNPLLGWFRMGGHMCLTHDHDVLTTRGWISIDQVQLTDRVLSLQQIHDKQKYKDEDMRLQWTNVNALIELPAPPQLYTFKNEHINITSTDTHAWYTRNKHDDSSWRRIYSSDMDGRCMIPVAGLNMNPAYRWSDDMLSFLPSDIDSNPRRCDAWMELIGLFLANGEVVNRQVAGASGLKEVRIRHRIGQDGEYVRNLSQRLGWSDHVEYHDEPTSDGAFNGYWSITIAGLCDWLWPMVKSEPIQSRCFYYRSILPQLSTRQARSLIHGFVVGNGSIHSSSPCLHSESEPHPDPSNLSDSIALRMHCLTRSVELRDDLQLIGAMAGYQTGYEVVKIDAKTNEHEQSESDGNGWSVSFSTTDNADECNNKPLFTQLIDDSHRANRENGAFDSSSIIHHPTPSNVDKVYCISTSSGNFYTRKRASLTGRSGSCFSGNCLVFPPLGCSLYDFLRANHFRRIFDPHIKHISQQLLTTCAGLHQLGVVHADIKPENILLVDASYHQVQTSQGVTLNVPLCSDVRLVDFGTAVFDSHEKPMIVVSRSYRPLEVVLGLEWSYGVDVWAIGCVMMELYSGHRLFNISSSADDVAHVKMMEQMLGPVPEEIKTRSRLWNSGAQSWVSPAPSPRETPQHSPATTPQSTPPASPSSRRIQTLAERVDPSDSLFLDVVSKMLKYDQNERISAIEALTHPYFTQT